MTMGVVDRLEPVDVEHDRREGSPVARERRPLGVEAIHAVPPVRQPRERVGQGRGLDPGFCQW